jgi:hypothetical protein
LIAIINTNGYFNGTSNACFTAPMPQ